MTRNLLPFFTLLLLCPGLAVLYAQPLNPTFYTYTSSSEHLISDQVTAIAQDTMGFIWVGTKEGLSRYAVYRIKHYQANRENDSSLISNQVRALLSDSHDQMWVGTDQGVSLYNRPYDSFQTIAYTAKGPIGFNSLVEDKEGVLWAGTDIGLARYVAAHGQFEWVNEDTTGMPSLPQQAVPALALDSAGALWFVQGSCVIRYGAGQPDTLCLPTQGISLTDLDFDADGNLWVGSQGNGLYRVNLGTQEITRMGAAENYPSSGATVLSIMVSRQGVLWVGTGNGVSVRWPNKDQFVTYEHDLNDNLGLSDYVVTDVFEDHADGIWLGTEAGGVTYFHEADNLFEYFGPAGITGEDQSLVDYHVTSLLEATDHRIWLGSRVGVSVYNRQKGAFTHYPIDPSGTGRLRMPVLAITQSGPNSFWLGTDQGLAQFDPISGRYDSVPMPGARKSGEHPQQVNDLWLDEDNHLWLATEYQGLLQYSLPYRQFMPASKSEGMPRAMESLYELLPDTARQLLWIGGQGGLMKKPFGSSEYQAVALHLQGDKLPLSPIIQCLTLDEAGNLWAGTQERGIWKIDPESGAVVLYGEDNGLRVKNIRSIVFDPQGNLWASSNEGLIRVNFTAKDESDLFRRFDVDDNIQGNNFFDRAGLLTHNGLLYFGGVSGLNVVDPNQVRDFNMDIKVAITGLRIGDQNITLADSSGLLPVQIACLDTLVLGPQQNTFSLFFSNLDFVRPDDVEYKLMLEGYETEWQSVGGKPDVTYSNLPSGRTYTFRLQARSSFGNWTPTKPLHIYLTPAYYETLWFQVLVGISSFVLIVGLIAAGFRFRTYRIRQTNARLAKMVKKSTAALQSEINERIRTEHALMRAKDAAEIANRVKSEFLANMSHEIRTPLNGIIGLTGLVLATSLNTDQNQYLTHVKQSADSLLRMVDDLLDFARLEAGQLKFVKKPFGLKALLENVEASFQFEAQQKNLRLISHLDEALPPQLIGDKDRIRQILINLLTNAFKFTEQGSVTITFQKSERRVGKEQVGIQFSVADTGVGIEENKLQDIFDDFTQADNTTTRKYGGIGLGLALCRELIHQMRGEIWVESKVKEGSTFYFFLPLDELETPIKPLVKKTDQSLTKPLIFKPYHLLVVEDNSVNQLVITRLLKKVGLSADIANNGKEALEKLEKSDYPLVLMDLHMPEMDGYEAVRNIRNGYIARDGVKDVPIIAVTAAARKVDEDRCRSLGMNDFLTKPVHPPSLYQALRQWLPEDNE